jgi:predicted PurR-regulated permease PerM
MSVDAISRFFGDVRVKRLTSLATFVLLLAVFRHLVPLFIFFLIFSRTLQWLAERVAPLTRLPHKAAVAILVVLFMGLVGVGIGLGAYRAIPIVAKARMTMPERIEAFKRTHFYMTLEEHKVDLEKYTEQAKHTLAASVGYLQATGRLLLHALFGFILALIYLFEKEHMDEWMASLPANSFSDMLLHYFKLLAAAVMVTVKLQVVVAAVNAVLTLPVLWLLHLRHIPTLLVLIFVFGLIPVLGNFLSGAILIAVTYTQKGLPGVAVLVVLTFVLHKIESYYLNPRLASAHVKMPSLAIVVSLILFEHMFGVAGLFMSFPFLYVAYGVRAYFTDQKLAVGVKDLPIEHHG